MDSPRHPHHPDAIVDSSWSADSEHHLVYLRRHLFPAGDPETVAHVLDPYEAVRLGMALCQAGASALSTQVKDAVAGECTTCGNVRLVNQVGPGGHESAVACPDCRTTWDEEPPPTFDPLRELERHVLRGRRRGPRG